MTRRVAIVDPHPLPEIEPVSGTTYLANLVLSLVIEAEAFGFEPIVRLVRRGRPPLSPFGDTEVVGALYLDRYEMPDGAMMADAFGMPVVTVGSGRRCAVWPDSREGVRLAFRHLTELGHQRIVHFRGPVPMFAAVERADEFRRLLARHPEIDGRVAVDEIEMAAELARSDRPTAILAFSDGHAQWAAWIARSLGLSIPRDVSLIGFDDDVHSTAMAPQLTTVRNSTDETARIAFGMLARWLDTGEPPEEPGVVPVSFVLRESTAPAP